MNAVMHPEGLPQLKIRPEHLALAAIVYVRQSTRGQVLEHTESTRLQYALAGRAVALGWARSQVIVIDDDLGVSAAVPDSREGFARLVTEVTMGRAGVVLGIEMSRLARTGKDWPHLLELCSLSGTLLADPDAVLRSGVLQRPRAAGVIRPRLTGVFNVAQRPRAPPALLVDDTLSSHHRQRRQGGRMSICVQPVQMSDGDRTWTVLGADHRRVEPVEEFLEHHRITGSSPHTVRAYAKALQLWWQYLELDGRDWAEADVPALAGFITWLRQGTPPGVVLLDPAAAVGPRLAESTLATRLAAVVSFYRYHHDAHGVAPALARAWSGPPRRSRYRAFLAHLDGRSRISRRSPMPVRPRRREVCPLLTPAQVAAILSACAARDAASGEWSGSLRDRLLFATLAETGMRLGEVLCLTHADWHPGSGGTPFIEVVPRGHPHGARVKGGRGRRIYVSDELERLYGDYLWELAERAGRAGREVSDEWFCFVNLDGEPRFAPMRPERVYRVADRLRRRLPGLPEGWSPHWLRHTHASALLLAGVPLHVVSRRLGHADVQTTMDLYGWVTEDAELRAVAGWRSFTGGWRVAGA